MQFTGGNTLPNIGKRISWQLATLAGGLALALSIGAATVALERGSRDAVEVAPAEPAATRPIIPAATQDAPSDLVLIVTGSQAEADALHSAMSTDSAVMPEAAAESGLINILTVDSPESEAAFSDLVASASSELMTFDMGVRVIDLREPSPAVAAASTSSGGGTENIVYVVGSEAEAVTLRQQFNEAGQEAPDDVTRDVLVIGPGDEELFNIVAGEEVATGTFQLVDLR